MSESGSNLRSGRWRAVQWGLLAVWCGCAALDMKRIPAGFLTSYGADLTQPAWLYILTRSLDDPARKGVVYRLFGVTAKRAAASILLGCAATEVSQYFWPHGLFAGTFDPLDMLAYAVGVGVCFAFDRS